MIFASAPRRRKQGAVMSNEKTTNAPYTLLIVLMARGPGHADRVRDRAALAIEVGAIADHMKLAAHWEGSSSDLVIRVDVDGSVEQCKAFTKEIDAIKHPARCLVVTCGGDESTMSVRYSDKDEWFDKNSAPKHVNCSDF